MLPVSHRLSRRETPPRQAPRRPILVRNHRGRRRLPRVTRAISSVTTWKWVVPLPVVRHGTRRKVLTIVRWFKSTCAVAGLVLASVVATPAVAVEDVSNAVFTDCRAGWFCVWQPNDGTGEWVETRRAQPDLTLPIDGYVFNDQVSLLWNRTNVEWSVHEHGGYGGRRLVIAPGWRGDPSPECDFGDLISSMRPEPAAKNGPLPD